MSANTTISGDFDLDKTMEENEAIEYISTALAKIVNATPDNEFRLSALQAAEATNLSEFTSNIQEQVRERYKEMHELSKKSRPSQLSQTQSSASQSMSQTQNLASQSQSFASPSQSQCSTWLSQAESETSNYFSSQPIFDDDELTRMEPDDKPGTSNLPAFWYKEMHELSKKSQQSQSMSQTQNSASQSMSQTQNSASQSMSQTQNLASPSQSFASVNQLQCSTWMSQAESETSNDFSSQKIFDDNELTRMKPDDEPSTSSLPAFWYKEMHELNKKSQQSQSMSQTHNSASQSIGQTQNSASQSIGQTQTLASQSMSQTPNSASQSMSQTPQSASQSMSQTPNSVSQAMNQTSKSASQSMSQTPNSVSQSMNQTSKSASQSVSQTQNLTSQSMSQTPNSVSQSMNQTPNSVSQSMNQTKNLASQSMSQRQNLASQSMSQTSDSDSQSQSFDFSSKSIADLWKDRNMDMIEFWRDMNRGKVTKRRLIQQITTSFGHLREYCLLKTKSWSWFLDVQLYVIRCVRLYEYTFRQGITEVSTLMPFFLEQTLKKFLTQPARISVTSTIWHQIREVLTVIFHTTTNSDLLILMLEALEKMQTEYIFLEDFIRKHVIPLVGRKETAEKHAERLIVAHVMKEFSRFREEILNQMTCVSPIAGLF